MDSSKNKEGGQVQLRKFSRLWLNIHFLIDMSCKSHVLQHICVHVSGEYLQNQQCYDPNGCAPCETLKPSCKGLLDGNNTFPGRPKEYIVCAAERTIAMEICEFDYDPSQRKCGQDMCMYTVPLLRPLKIKTILVIKST